MENTKEEAKVIKQLPKDEILGLMDESLEIRRKISGSELGKQLTKVTETLKDLIRGFISFDQQWDPESLDVSGVKEGDVINIYESGEDGALAMVLRRSEDDDELEFEFLEGYSKGKTHTMYYDFAD